MTRDEAKRVVHAIMQGGGYADHDLAESVIDNLRAVFPAVDWSKLVEEDDDELFARTGKEP